MQMSDDVREFMLSMPLHKKAYPPLFIDRPFCMYFCTFRASNLTHFFLLLEAAVHGTFWFCRW